MKADDRPESRDSQATKFAALNGWQQPGRYGFTFNQLARRAFVGDRPPYDDQPQTFSRRNGKLFIETFFPYFTLSDATDHPLFFRESGFAAAIVGQPYHPHNGVAKDVVRITRDGRLITHVPPATFASFHNPGQCRFIVFTRPGVTVRWLPEQADEFSRLAIHDSEWDLS